MNGFRAAAISFALSFAVACSVGDRSGYKFGSPEGGSGGMSEAESRGGNTGAAGQPSRGGVAGQPGRGGGAGQLGQGGLPGSGRNEAPPSAGRGSTGGTMGVSGGVSYGGTTTTGTGGASIAGGALGVSGSAGSIVSGGTASSGGGALVGGSSGAGGGTAGAAGGDGCNQELLQNGGFEQGGANWLLESNFPGITAIVPSTDASLKAEGVAPKAGSYLAWLGGIPDNQFESYYVSISQVVQIPKGASTLTLSGYIRIKTEEPDVNNTYDRAFIQLEWPDDRPDLLWLPVEWTIDKANADWVQFSVTKMETAQIAGQMVMLRARAETDPNLKSSFWLDSLSLVAKCGR